MNLVHVIMLKLLKGATATVDTLWTEQGEDATSWADQSEDATSWSEQTAGTDIWTEQ